MARSSFFYYISWCFKGFYDPCGFVKRAATFCCVLRNLFVSFQNPYLPRSVLPCCEPSAISVVACLIFTTRIYPVFFFENLMENRVWYNNIICRAYAGDPFGTFDGRHRRKRPGASSMFPMERNSRIKHSRVPCVEGLWKVYIWTTLYMN